ELDVEATSDLVELAWPQSATVTGVVSATEPALTQAEIDRFAEEVARPALAEPITVDVEGDISSISTNQLARLLSVVESEDHVLSLELDAEGVLEVVSGQLDEATVSPRNASLALDDGEAVITKAR